MREDYCCRELTPVERAGPIWVKRDDRFEVAGVCGGKVRTAYALALAAVDRGDGGLITAGSRHSPQVNIVAHIARHLGLPCRVHVPDGETTPELDEAAACGAAVVRHRPGYNTVIVARALADADASGFCYVPFGMECYEAPAYTALQVGNLPDEVETIIVPVGSAMSLAGILWGLLREDKLGVDVIGVRVGADPTKRLDRWGPAEWRRMVFVADAAGGYGTPAPAAECDWHGVPLDPYYEAKCYPWLAEYASSTTMLWVVGLRATAEEV